MPNGYVPLLVLENAVLTYSPKHKLFVWRGDHAPRQAGLKWSAAGNCWYTPDPFVAATLGEWCPEIESIRQNIIASADSSTLGADGGAPTNKGLYPFQKAGVASMMWLYRGMGRKHILLADEQGLGKSPQSLCFANLIGAKKLLVICPASLRLNWLREIKTWHKLSPGAEALLTGGQKLNPDASVVTSYNLAGGLKKYEPDLVIVDEAHAIKNPGTARTKLVLGNGRSWPGFVSKAPTVFLTGTPIPNGRPNEIWPILYRCVPEAIENLKYWDFVRKYCDYFEDPDYGPIIKGAKAERVEELYARLRGYGFMIRRLKKNVLKDLPPIRYKLVVFPANGETRKVLQRESRFDAAEIIARGAPVGSALPEIRREMGIASVPQAVEYITDLLDGGARKVIAFGHHLEVMGELDRRLKRFRPVIITGSTPQKARQAAVDAFQTDPGVRVFCGNEAAEEGITLTAGADVVLVEPEWVPGKNEQRPCRAHRIGQKDRVIVHILVVEGSLSAKILGAAEDKMKDIEQILG